MKIKDLPGSGSKFRASAGAGNFSKKFTSATKYGDLRNLADNKKSIIKAVKKSERVIKLGGFNRLRQIRAFKDIKKEEGARMTKDDKRDVKKILKHLGEAGKQEAKIEKKVTMDKSLNKDTSFKDERRKEMRSKISRFSRTRGGGESSLEFSSQPQDSSKDTMSESGKLLRDRFLRKETMLKNRMPRNRVEWDKEKNKRLEVSSLERDMNKKPNEKDGDDVKGENKKDSFEPFQNL